MNEHEASIKVPWPLLESLADLCGEVDTTPAKLLAGMAIHVLTGADHLIGDALDAAPLGEAKAWGFSEPLDTWGDIEPGAAVTAVLGDECDRRGVTVQQLVFGLHGVARLAGAKAMLSTARLADSIPGKMNASEFEAFARERRG